GRGAPPIEREEAQPLRLKNQYLRPIDSRAALWFHGLDFQIGRGGTLMRTLSILAILAVVSAGTPLHAQSTNAWLTGRVLDPSRAAVPDAAVVVVGVDTNSRRQTTTDRAGEYSLANLPPGR